MSDVRTEETIIEEILRAAVQEAVLHEREACAKIADQYQSSMGLWHQDCRRDIAIQIRARGSK